MNDKQILSLVRKEINRAFKSPSVIVRPESIEAIAFRVAIESAQPYTNYVQTTDATETVIKTIELQDYEGGLLDVDILGMVTDGSALITGKYVVRYHRTTAMTFSFEEILFNAGGTTAIIEFGGDIDENIEARVTGVAATDIDWNCYVTQKKILATAAP